ncbi:glycosyltransferase [Candidatus Calescamantes bacterium]|nr:glycosyltransferase [Candidatus Calescamantes bacterium]
MEIVILSSYPPRECGIATYTYNFTKNIEEVFPQINIRIIAINDSRNGEVYTYPKKVIWCMDQSDVTDFGKTGDFFQSSPYRVLHIQHEFGIYGGAKNFSIFKLIEKIKKPFLVTLHSTRPNPEYWEKEIISHLHQRNSFTIVQSNTAKRIMIQEYNGIPEKVVYIPHGVPVPPLHKRTSFRKKWEWENKIIALSFGLLKTEKGLENMIEATSMIKRKYPDFYYYILGKPHPRHRTYHGRFFLDYLKELAKKTGADNNVIIPGEYLDEETLLSLLIASDMVITPYARSAEKQTVSGVLSYALGCGKAVISTPYLHARELLAEGRGILVDFENVSSLVRAVTRLIEEERLKKSIEQKSFSLGKKFWWPEAVKRYMELYKCLEKENFQ